MSRKERVIAALLLVVAIGGGGLIPRLLATPAAPLGVALGSGPSPSVVQAPTIPRAGHHTSQSTASPPSAAVATPVVPVTPAAAQPAHTAGAGRPKPTPVSSTPPPPTATVPLNPSLPSTQPAAAVRQSASVLPPGQAKKLSGREMTPPGHTKTPPGQAKKSTGHAKLPPAPGPPSPAKAAAKAGRRSAPHDLPGSGHGRQVPQVPSHPVGNHHRGVGHLAPPSSRPAPAARQSRPQARPQDRGRRGKGGEGPSPSAPVAPGSGHNGNSSQGSDAPPSAPVTHGNGNGGNNGNGKGRGR